MAHLRSHPDSFASHMFFLRQYLLPFPHFLHPPRTGRGLLGLLCRRVSFLPVDVNNTRSTINPRGSLSSYIVPSQNDLDSFNDVCAFSFNPFYLLFSSLQDGGRVRSSLKALCFTRSGIKLMAQQSWNTLGLLSCSI